MSEAKVIQEPSKGDIAAAMARQAEQEDLLTIFKERASQFRMGLARAQEQIKEMTTTAAVKDARIAELEAELVIERKENEKPVSAMPSRKPPSGE